MSFTVLWTICPIFHSSIEALSYLHLDWLKGKIYEIFFSNDSVIYLSDFSCVISAMTWIRKHFFVSFPISWVVLAITWIRKHSSSRVLPVGGWPEIWCSTAINKNFLDKITNLDFLHFCCTLLASSKIYNTIMIATWRLL